MTDTVQELEAELSAMTPRPMGPRLTDGLAAILEEPAERSWSDRVLVLAMGAGALAACIIIALLALEPAGAPPAPTHSFAVRGAEFSDQAYAFAGAVRSWQHDMN
jgi:hypothetical protein